MQLRRGAVAVDHEHLVGYVTPSHLLVMHTYRLFLHIEIQSKHMTPQRRILYQAMG